MQIRSRYRIPESRQSTPSTTKRARVGAGSRPGRHPGDRRRRRHGRDHPSRSGTRTATHRRTGRRRVVHSPGARVDYHARTTHRPRWGTRRRTPSADPARRIATADAESSLDYPRAAPMLIGYVSDERYLALPDVALEFVDDRGAVVGGPVTGDRRGPRRPPGRALHASPCSSPATGRSAAGSSVPAASPHQFRLLADGLSGYVWPKWVRGGEAGEFRVHCRRAVPPGAVAIRLVAGARPRASAGSTSTARGRRCRSRPTATTPRRAWSGTRSATTARRTGSSSPPPIAAACTTSAPARPRARGSRSPGSSRRRGPTAPLAVLASNITWNAYNNFGGRSNYIHADELPPTPTVNSRYDLQRYRDAEFLSWDAPSYAPLSFDRPEPFNHIDFDERITDPIEGRQACHLAPAEWRLLGWLEHRGLPYDFYAETQLDDGTLDLSAYRALVLSVHPEYWTRRMYDRVKQWVFEEGGRLLYLGGNGLNCEVEIRRLVDAWSTTGRSPAWTSPGSAAESRFAHASRVGGQPARRGLHARRRDDRRPVPRRGRRPLGLRRDRPEGGRPVRPEVAAQALPRRRVRARDGQAVAQLARRTRGCWRRG